MVGCGKDGAGKKDEKTVYKTPDEVFEAAKAAANKDDFKTFVNCLAPETVDEMATVMAGMSAMMVAAPEDPTGKFKLDDEAKAIVAVAAKHGVTAEAVKKIPMDGKTKEDNDYTCYSS